MSIIRDSLVTEEEQLISTKGRGDWREEMTSILSFKKKKVSLNSGEGVRKVQRLLHVFSAFKAHSVLITLSQSPVILS